MIEALAGMILALGGVLALVWRAWARAQVRADRAEKAADALRRVREYEHEASRKSDDDLADSISRRGL